MNTAMLSGCLFATYPRALCLEYYFAIFFCMFYCLSVVCGHLLSLTLSAVPWLLLIFLCWCYTPFWISCFLIILFSLFQLHVSYSWQFTLIFRYSPARAWWVHSVVRGREMTDTGGEWSTWHLNEREGACPFIPDPIGPQRAVRWTNR